MRCSTPMAISRREWRRSRNASSTNAGSTPPVQARQEPGRLRPSDRAVRASLCAANYQGKPRDVMTLAHELGHGVHQVLAAPNGALMAPTPLTLAETASVFGEMLTFRALLAEGRYGAERRAMLAAKVEDMLNTVVRQIAFYSFERKRPYRAPQRRTHRRPDLRPMDERAGRKPRAGDRTRPPATRPSGPISRISSIRPFMSMPMRSATAS